MKANISKKVVKSLVALGILAACSAAYIFFVRLGYLEPELRREMISAQVHEAVDVYRDFYGIPHIYGQSTNDALFALGYTMAEDRLLQIEMMRRIPTIGLASVFGSSLIDYDKKSQLKAYTQSELSSMIDGMQIADREAFLSMVAGINHYVKEAIENPDEKLPLEFESLEIELRPYTPEDILAGVTKVLRTFGASGGTELTNQVFLQEMTEQYGAETAQIIFDDILPLIDPDAYSITADHDQAPESNSQSIELTNYQHMSFAAQAASLALQEQELASAEILSELGGISRGASRTIVIGAERSATGNPLILQGTADGSEVHLSTPDFEFAGLAIAPLGLPVQGRSLNIGVVITTGERDTIDTFAVQTDPQDKNKYFYKGEWLKMDLITKTIVVKGGENVTHEIARTVHGPVILRDEENNIAYSQRWAMWMQEADIWATALNSLKHDSAESYAASLAHVDASNTNISYADKDGGIGFRHTGNLPIRAPGIDPRLPTKGDGSQDWLGMHPNSESPSLHNPKKDYIHAWNNNPAPGTVYGDASRWGKSFRTHLPLELIESKEKISIEDLKEFNKIISAAYYSVDLTLTSPKFFAPYFKEAAAFTDDPRIKQAAEMMADWDGLLIDADQDGYYDHTGQLLFHKWLPTALDTIFKDDIGDWWRKLDEELYIRYQTSLLLRALEGDAAGQPMKWDYFNGETRVDVVIRSIATTLDKLSETYANTDLASWQQPVFWRYMSYEDSRGGDKAVIRRSRSTSYSGGATMLRYLPKSMLDNGAPEWLAIMEISPDKPYYYSAIPSGGQSRFINTSWKASPHINDQYKLHNALEFKTVHLDKATIVENHESHLTIRSLQ